MLTLVKSLSESESFLTGTRRKKSAIKKRSSAKAPTYANREVVAVLEGLLVKAKTGELTGLMYVVRLAADDHGVGVAGTYLSDLHSGLSAFCMVYGLLGEKLQNAGQHPE